MTYTPDDVRDSGTLVLRSSNVKDGEITLDDNVYVSPETVNSENVKPGDLVVVVRNGSRNLIGKHAQIKHLMHNTVIGAFMTGIRSEHAEFVNALLDTPRFKRDVDINIGATINQITGYMFSHMEFMVPSEREQDQIGAFFRDLDHLITLHQYKLFMVFYNNRIIITYFWEQRKWIDTVDISTEMVDPTSGEYDDLPHIAPGNIESFTGRILDNVKSVKEEQLISGKFRFKPGDVIYGKINPQLGKYFYACVDGLTSADAYVFNGKNGITQNFLFSLLQTEDFFKYSVSVSKRSGMPKINRDELNAYCFLAPDEEEQNIIGNFLLNIDNLITLHQSKCDKLKIIKKLMLNNLFPKNGEKNPKWRFNGFNDDWEQRKFFEIAQRESLVRFSTADFPSVEYEDVSPETGTLNKDIQSKEIEKKGFTFDNDNILYGKLRPYLHNWLNPNFSGVAVGDWWVLKPIRVDKNFLYMLIQTQKFDNIANQSAGSKMPRADWNHVSNASFMIPKNIDEQRRIGSYFESLDNLITLHQSEVERLKKVKQFFLDKMFI